MKENVSVNEAIRKGKIKLVYLPMAITFSIIALSIVLSINQILNSWIIPLGFLVGFSAGWLTWNYFVDNWKNWAFENVYNILELRRKAIEQFLIWDNGNWFEKMECKNDLQKTKLKLLETKFFEKDFYTDDLSVPKETIIIYSNNRIIFSMIVYLSISTIGIYFLLDKHYLGLFPLALGLYLALSQNKKRKDKSAQIIINEKGIQLKNQNLIPWNKIHNDRILNRSKGKFTTNHLIFNDEEISMEELKIKFDELEKLLHVYRIRFEKNNS